MKKLITLLTLLSLTCMKDEKPILRLEPKTSIEVDQYKIPEVRGKRTEENWVDNNYDGIYDSYIIVWDTNNNGIGDIATHHYVRYDRQLGEWEYQGKPYLYIVNLNEDDHPDMEYLDYDMDGIAEERIIHDLNPKVKKNELKKSKRANEGDWE